MNNKRTGLATALGVLGVGLATIVGILLLLAATAQPVRATRTVELKPLDSAYVVANLNDNGPDPLGLRSLNTGTMNITKLWYAWNLTLVNPTTGKTTGYIPVKILSIAYMKFDLSNLSSPAIQNASLNLFAVNSNLTAPTRLLVAYQVDNDSWSQSTLTFNNAPGFDARVNATGTIANGQKWWWVLDMTQMVRAKAGGKFSIAITFLELYQHNEEQVEFDSPRAAIDRPYLSVALGSQGPLSSIGAFFGTSLTSAFWVSPGAVMVAALLAAGLYLLLRARNRQGTVDENHEGAKRV
jgi:hypothetical protein